MTSDATSDPLANEVGVGLVSDHNGATNETPSEPTRRWLMIKALADRLVVDEDLAMEFERRPGKVLRLLGVGELDVADVLSAVQRAREGFKL